MKKQIIMLCLFFMGLGTVTGQSLEDVLENRKVTVNLPDHTVTAYLRPVKSVALESDRTYSWFSGHEIHTTRGGYSGHLLHGLYQDFYLDKNLKETGYFDKGLKQGLWKSWNGAGILKEEWHWNKGQKNGDYAMYRETGILQEKGKYKKDHRNGCYEKYNEAGLLAEKGKYKNDLLNGKQELFAGLKTTKGADSIRVVHYKSGLVVQPKHIVPKIKLPGFIKHPFKKKTTK